MQQLSLEGKSLRENLVEIVKEIGANGKSVVWKDVAETALKRKCVPKDQTHGVLVKWLSNEAYQAACTTKDSRGYPIALPASRKDGEQKKGDSQRGQGRLWDFATWEDLDQSINTRVANALGNLTEARLFQAVQKRKFPEQECTNVPDVVDTREGEPKPDFVQTNGTVEFKEGQLLQ